MNKCECCGGALNKVGLTAGKRGANAASSCPECRRSLRDQKALQRPTIAKAKETLGDGCSLNFVRIGGQTMAAFTVADVPAFLEHVKAEAGLDWAAEIQVGLAVFFFESRETARNVAESWNKR